MSGLDEAGLLGACLCVLVGVFSGLKAVRTSRAEGRKFRFFAGLTMLGCGVGCLLDVCRSVLPGWLYAASYVGFAIVVTTLFGMAVSRLPASRLPLQRNRIAAETLMIGTAGGGALYRVMVLNHAGAGHQYVLQFLLAVFVGVMGLAIVAATIESRRGMWLASLGVVALGSGQAAAIGAMQFGWADWPARAMALVGWAAAVAGVFRVPPTAPHFSERAIAALEQRHLAIVGTVIVTAAVAGTIMFIVIRRPYLDSGNITLIVLFFVGLWWREITRARQSGQMLAILHEQAQHDPLTSLGNRRALRGWLQELAELGGSPVALMTIDLDGFKDVNDLAGHQVGDQVLQVVAEDLRELAGRSGGRVYRLGGDEFAVVLPAEALQAAAVAERSVETVREAAASVSGAVNTSVGASVGLRHVPLADLDEERLLAGLTESGHAMRSAKRSGRGRVVIFDEQLQASRRRAKEVEHRLRSDEFGPEVHYQPVVSLVTGRMVGVEALARWQDAELGLVPPNEFVEVAEQGGLILELGERILRMALMGAREAGLVERGMTIAVNVSTLQLRSPGFVTTVADALACARVPSSSLVIEVTESVFVRTDDPATLSLQRLVAMGVSVALDDFGSGYASFGCLSRLPVQIIKLDRSLTAGFDDPRTLAIARSVLEMARGLGLGVVVEGIESVRQQEVARSLGAEHAQGWLYAKALSLEALNTFIAAQEKLMVIQRHSQSA